MAQIDKCKVSQAFWRAAEQFGIPPAALLRQARLPATLHLGAQAFVTTAQYFALMQAMTDLSGDPALGIRMVRSVDTAVHPPSSLAAFYARDYRDGLTRLARFKRLCTPEQLQVVEVGGDCTISTEWPFAAVDLNRPFPEHNPEMLEMLTPALGAALGELEAQSSIAEQVKIVMKRSLASGQPGLSDVAKQLA